MKFRRQPAAAFPGSPYSARGTSTDYTYPGGGFGNNYFNPAAGANSVPFIVDVTNQLAGGVTLNQVVGNEIQVHSVSLNGIIKTLENQSTYDEWATRITVLRLKMDPFAMGVTTNSALVQYLSFPATGTGPGTGPWYTCPWDQTKCKVLYDRRSHRHGSPLTITTQANVQFKAVPVKIRLRWKNGLRMVFNKQSDLSGSSATVSKFVNPILIIFQSGAIIGTESPASEALPGFFAKNAGETYISFRDS